jgi:hypothetical protein
MVEEKTGHNIEAPHIFSTSYNSSNLVRDNVLMIFLSYEIRVDRLN